jgi:hypothetical protein
MIKGVQGGLSAMPSSREERDAIFPRGKRHSLTLATRQHQEIRKKLTSPALFVPGDETRLHPA